MNHDGLVSPDELGHARPNLEPLLGEALTVRVNGDAIAITDPSFQLDDKNNFRIAGSFRANDAKALTVESTLIKRLPRGHRQFITLLDDHGITLAEALLSADQDVIDVDMPQRLAEENPRARTSSFREFFVMGVEHILTGYDHLLFLFGLLIAMTQFRATLWVITCFTLAHSTTLALAAFDLVRVSGRMVEPLVAATIVYVGVENLLRSEGPTGRWRLTLIFGLVHGLGFATDLKEKLAGVIGAEITVPLLVLQPRRGARPDGRCRAGAPVDLVAAERAGFRAALGAGLLIAGGAGRRMVAVAADAAGISASVAKATHLHRVTRLQLLKRGTQNHSWKIRSMKTPASATKWL